MALLSTIRCSAHLPVIHFQRVIARQRLISGAGSGRLPPIVPASAWQDGTLVAKAEKYSNYALPQVQQYRSDVAQGARSPTSKQAIVAALNTVASSIRLNQRLYSALN